jgi:hypothetical protein
MKGLRNIGAYLRGKREEAAMTPTTLSDITGVPVAQIIMIENANKEAEFEQLVRLAWWFKLRIKASVVDA